MNDEASALHADPARAFDGQYQLGAEIGAGAYGVVYRGVDERLDKPVAIKVWHSRLDETAPVREQYDTEARALTALDHPNLVAITDYGIAGEAPYLIMELLEGETLEARMRAGALQASLTQTFMQSVLRALGYMHMRGVIHRNLKPDNVFLHKLDADTEQLKLLDLGVESLPANTNAGTQSPRSAYDPPERDAGAEPDGRSDVYAAGVMMLHMLSGREPTRELVRAAAESADLLEKLLPSSPPEVRAFISRAIATERAARFGNADQMLRSLLELPTPWADDPPGAVAAPASTKKASVMPVGIEPTELLEAPPADELLGAPAKSEPEPAAASDDVVLGPIGLMAKLRGQKRLLLIGAGVMGLAAAGGAVALLTQRIAAPEQVVPAGAAQKQAQGNGKGAKKIKAAPVAPPEDEADEAPDPLIKLAQAGAAEAPKHAEEGAEGAAGKQAESAQLIAKSTVAHKAPAEPTPSAAGAQPAAVLDERGPVTGHGPASPAAATSAKGPTAPAAQAAPAKKPAPIGAERHIEPDKDEIRLMLALAISAQPRVPAKNPWNIEVPTSLQALRDAIAKGEPGSSSMLKALRHYNAANPQDAYGHLLLAGFYANRGFSLDALDQYDMAFRIDSSSRGAPEMLKHALDMVGQGIAEGDAARFITRVYGREASAAIAQRIAQRGTSAEAARRFKQLQARVASAKRP